ncbi:MAG TPA: octaprenyl diphosphate synthase [Gammaproteobacteria bacterium]|jgi:octaprenyl-diphosphate synthase|nr:octaprenyl diphosphate synthase [Gammaproteobacteria bacterium]
MSFPVVLQHIRTLIDEDFRAVDAMIHSELHSEVALINQLGHYIVNGGGKRLRPLLVLLTARLCDYQGRAHIDLAAIIEFIHTATLLHDDVVDTSKLRRGRETANEIWGNEAAVLVGDFLYSRTFQMMVRVGDMRVMEIMADTTNMIAEGEVLQLLNAHDPATTEERHLEVIRRKTAKLFEAAAQVGAVLAGQPVANEQALARYGMHLGIAFQLIDDALDYGGDSDELGKNVGNDLAEGKPTLPLIYAMRHGSNTQARLVREAIENGRADCLTDITTAISETGALDYTRSRAQAEADAALEALSRFPASTYRDALENLARFAVDRNN